MPLLPTARPSLSLRLRNGSLLGLTRDKHGPDTNANGHTPYSVEKVAPRIFSIAPEGTTTIERPGYESTSTKTAYRTLLPVLARRRILRQHPLVVSGIELPVAPLQQPSDHLDGTV